MAHSLLAFRVPLLNFAKLAFNCIFSATLAFALLAASPAHAQLGGQACSPNGVTAGPNSNGETLKCTSGAWALASWSAGASNSIYYDSGNVGIGTANPTVTLDVAGSVHVRPTSGNANLWITDGSATNTWDVAARMDGLFTIYDGTNYKTPFSIQANSPTNAFYIAQSGNVGIGIANPQTKLAVAGIAAPSADNTYTLGSATYRWSAVYAANGTIQTSDARLKDQVAPVAYGLGEVMKLRPVSFVWKDKPAQGKHLGLIAQEVQPLVPEVVSVGDDKNKTLGLDYAELVPVLIKAVQELKADNDNLRHEFDAYRAAHP
jgi:hypothetical protein